MPAPVPAPALRLHHSTHHHVLHSPPNQRAPTAVSILPQAMDIAIVVLSSISVALQVADVAVLTFTSPSISGALGSCCGSNLGATGIQHKFYP